MEEKEEEERKRKKKKKKKGLIVGSLGACENSWLKKVPLSLGTMTRGVILAHIKIIHTNPTFI